MTGAPLALGSAARRAPAVTRRLTAAHAAVVRRSGGRIATRWFGSRVLVLETVGRISGLPRSAALVYLPDGDDLVVVPANAGAPRPPAWWLNLRAAGEAVAVLGRERRRVRGVEARGAERERLWRRFATVTPVAHYERPCAPRAAGRRPAPDVRLTLSRFFQRPPVQLIPTSPESHRKPQ